MGREKIQSVDDIQEGDLLNYRQRATHSITRVVEVNDEHIVEDKWDEGVQTKEMPKERLREIIGGETPITLYREIEDE